MLVHGERAETGWQLTLPAGTTDIKVTCHQSDRDTKGVLHYHPSLNHTNPESPRECILIALFLQTCCNLQKDSLTLWKSFSKRISSLCQKKKKECANLFLYQQLKVHFFLWGVCVCIHVCVRACHWPDLGAGGWLSVDQLLMAKIKATFRVYFLKNITTGKVVNGIIFGHFCFVLFWFLLF